MLNYILIFLNESNFTDFTLNEIITLTFSFFNICTMIYISITFFKNNNIKKEKKDFIISQIDFLRDYLSVNINIINDENDWKNYVTHEKRISNTIYLLKKIMSGNKEYKIYENDILYIEKNFIKYDKIVNSIAPRYSEIKNKEKILKSCILNIQAKCDLIKACIYNFKII